MRKRSKTSTATERSRRGSSMRRHRRQTTLRAQATRATARRATRTRRRTTSSRRGQRSGTRTTAHITTDYDTIREWAESRGGWPASVSRTARREPAGILRIDFPGYSGEGSLKPISWENWFEKFEKNNLAFLFQERTADGRQSRFFKLIERE